jgi:hypothetical protein
MTSKSNVYYFLIAIGLFLIISSIVMLLKETEQAQEFCNSMNGTYKFNLYHFCNGELIQKYKSFGRTFWSFELDLTNNKVINESLLNLD